MATTEETRAALERLRAELGCETVDLLDAIAVLLIEDAVIAALDADGLERQAPKLAKAYAVHAVEYRELAQAITSRRVTDGKGRAREG